MSRMHPDDNNETFHLGNFAGDEDEHWQPFHDDDIPSDDEPPESSDMPTEDQPPEDETQFDQMPDIEPEEEKEEKRPRGRPPKEKAEPKIDEGALVEREYQKLLRSDMKTNKKKALPAAPKAKPKKGRAGAVTDEEIAVHQALVQRIDKYRTSIRFRECLAESRLPLQNPGDLSVEELEELLQRINVVIGNRHSMGDLLGTGICAGATFIEKNPKCKAITGAFGADLDGWSALMSGDEEFMDLCEQISIDYSFFEGLSPEKKLLFSMFKCAGKAVAINKVKRYIACPIGAQNASIPVSSAGIPTAPAPTANLQSKMTPVYGDPAIRDY